MLITQSIIIGRQATAWKHGHGGRGGQGNSKPKDKEYKFATQEQIVCGGYHSYMMVKEQIIQEVQCKYKYRLDMSKSLRDGKLIDMSTMKPSRMVSTNAKEEERAIKQDGFNIDYQEEFRIFFDQKSC